MPSNVCSIGEIMADESWQSKTDAPVSAIQNQIKSAKNWVCCLEIANLFSSLQEAILAPESLENFRCENNILSDIYLILLTVFMVVVY